MTMTVVGPSRFHIYRGYVPRAMCKAVTRRIWQGVREGDLSMEQIDKNEWMPHLRYSSEVLAVQELLEGWRTSGQKWADPQILVRLPDEDDASAGYPHVDTLPPWAAEEGFTRYAHIFGVELTSTPPNGGSILIDNSLVHLRAGDVLRMNPDLPHAGSPNRSGNVRMALYFRLLAPS